jgi:hypothetical protein
VRPYLKNNQQKRVGGVAQVVEYLPSKHKALNTTPSTTPPKREHLLYKDTTYESHNFNHFQKMCIKCLLHFIDFFLYYLYIEIIITSSWLWISKFSYNLVKEGF